MRNNTKVKIVSAFFIISLFLNILGCGKSSGSGKKENIIPELESNKSQKNETVEKNRKDLHSAEALQNALRNVAKSITPAVVNIRAIKVIRTRRFSRHDFFRFFRRRMPQKRRGRAIGSGFIINKKGYIITNAHVVKNAEKITIVLQDEREFRAKIVGTDPATDIALLKIKPSGKELPTCPIGNSDKLQVGDFAIAIGNPFGLRGTVTFGIISAKGRSRLSGTDASLKNFIQTDVPINRGNSGGPLLNIRGQVIGVNSMIYSPSGGNIGIGFAIPINIVKNVVAQIMKKGKVERGFIGAMIQPIDAATARHFGFKRKKGVIISSVKRGGPADRAGLRSGDIILEVNGKKIKTLEQLKRVISYVEPGNKIKMKILRKGKQIDITLRVGSMSKLARSNDANRYYQGGGENKPEEYNDNGVKKVNWMGLGVSDIDSYSGGGGSFFGREKQRQRRRSSVNGGVQVIEVNQDTSAERAGIKPGDIILSINYKNIRNLRQFKSFINKNGNVKSYFVKISRSGRIMFKTIEKSPQS